MKKILALMLMLALFAGAGFVMSSCSKDDDDKKDNNVVEPVEVDWTTVFGSAGNPVTWSRFEIHDLTTVRFSFEGTTFSIFDSGNQTPLMIEGTFTFNASTNKLAMTASRYSSNGGSSWVTNGSCRAAGLTFVIGSEKYIDFSYSEENHELTIDGVIYND